MKLKSKKEKIHDRISRTGFLGALTRKLADNCLKISEFNGYAIGMLGELIESECHEIRRMMEDAEKEQTTQ